MNDDDPEERTSVDGSTPQGELVAAHWARLSLTVDGAIEALRAKGIGIEQATADDLHRLDMLQRTLWRRWRESNLANGCLM